MRLQRAQVAGAGSPQPLDESFSAGGVTRFLRRFRLDFPTGAGAQGFFLTDDSVLDLAFSAREFEARGSGPAPVTLGNEGPGLVLRLATARPILRLRLVAAQAGDTLRGFRFDGSNVAEDPVAEAEVLSGSAALNLVDAKLVLRRRRNGSDLALTPGDIAGVTLRADVALPLLSCRILGDPAGEQLLATGESLPVSGSFGPALREALNILAARFAAGRASLPNPLSVELICSADHPCQVAISALDLGIELERRGFAGATEKQVLRFPGGRLQAQQLAIAFPGGMLPRQARLLIQHSGAARPGAADRQPAPGAPALPAAGGGTALRIPAGGQGAVRLLLPEARTVTGLFLLLAALGADATATVTLAAEAEGRPGELLAEALPIALAAGAPAARSVTLLRPAVLPAGPIWCLLRAGPAEIVCPLVAGAGGAALLGEAALPAAAGLTARLQVLGPSPSPAAGTDQKPAPDLLAVRLGGVPLAIAGEVLDLAPAWPAAGGSLALEVSSAVAGVVTLQPPLLRYTLA
ncbi:hypothetical protein [Roseomonas sp. 18066]|uniref:hypothetical protein n=1 Tax=Roseomonas sp. 18066 TaxID=2681412 RepID=UPI00135A9658|nr:hypothetical protein [Roseomonas sp. 18066]